MKDLVILGTGGNAYDTLDIIDEINACEPTWKVIGFLDDARERGSQHLGIEILGAVRDAARLEGCYFVNAIGSDQSFQKRPAILASTGLRKERFATLVHPLAGVSPRACLGYGVCVNYGASIAGNVTVGDHVSIGPACVIGHDSVIGDWSMLAPASVVSGFVEVGPSCYIGAQAVIRQRVKVGTQALVGMGAVVLKDVAEDTVVVGNPARFLERVPAGSLSTKRA
jgi:sugar O-acyltransferase (sialic acid O-acetyltransferase NeuD family)